MVVRRVRMRGAHPQTREKSGTAPPPSETCLRRRRAAMVHGPRCARNERLRKIVRHSHDSLVWPVVTKKMSSSFLRLDFVSIYVRKPGDHANHPPPHKTRASIHQIRTHTGSPFVHSAGMMHVFRPALRRATTPQQQQQQQHQQHQQQQYSRPCINRGGCSVCPRR
jgi:hypothetical protein